MGAKYDIIGLNYAELRKPDARIAAAVQDAIGQAKTVLNVGAGTGSYEPVDRRVTAVEPSLEMIRKRSSSAANVIQASADQLPFEDDAFEAAMAILTVHHWPDKKAGLQEMRRVTRGRIVLLTFDPSHRPWLTDYLPELVLRTVVGSRADQHSTGAARLQRWVPVCVLASPERLSRSQDPLRQFLVLGTQQSRTGIGATAAGSGNGRMGAPVRRAAHARRV
jgi:ubiquinone/menaquinone biosynthesis C-methylase UbiE